MIEAYRCTHSVRVLLPATSFTVPVDIVCNLRVTDKGAATGISYIVNVIDWCSAESMDDSFESQRNLGLWGREIACQVCVHLEIGKVIFYNDGKSRFPELRHLNMSVMFGQRCVWNSEEPTYA